MTFLFSSARELASMTEYLLQFDDTVKFKLFRDRRGTRLRLSTVKIPPFSYTAIDLEELTLDSPAKLAATEPWEISWAVNANFFARAVNCFQKGASVTLEIAGDLTCLLLYQGGDGNPRVQVAQVRVLHDLGPKLLVDHDVGTMLRIVDFRGFCDLVRAISVGDDDRCDVLLRHRTSTECELVMSTASVTSSLQLKTREGSDALKYFTGSARCADLNEYARLCTRMCKSASAVAILMGFGSNGITLFRLEWTTERGTGMADLFCCTG